MMDRSGFEDLVERIEDRFAGRPETLARHTWAWLLLGYGVIVLWTLLLTGAGVVLFVAGVVASGLAIPFIVAGGVLITLGLAQIGAVILTDHPIPRGRRLQPDEAPALRGLLDILQRDLACPPLDDILLTDDFNAAIVQHPRLGIFGWPRSWLLLGVPVTLAVTAEELASVLAHECGHLSRRHGYHSNRIFHMQQSWEDLFERLHNQPSGAVARLNRWLLRRFVTWYWPRLHARSFVLSREIEFQADRIAVETTSADTAASAIWRIDCSGSMLENGFWKDLWSQVDSLSEPPADFCDRLRAAFRNAPASPQSARWCQDALRRVTNNDDTHPAIVERLTAMEVAADKLAKQGFPVAVDVSAAETLFGDDRSTIEDDINRQWRDSVLSVWKDRHRRVTSIRRLATINGETPATEDRVTLWNETRRLMDAQGIDAAEPSLRHLLSFDPEHVGATLAMGQLRLSQGHEDGADLLRHVLSRRTRDWTLAAGQVLEFHYQQSGRVAELREVRRELDDFEKSRQAADRERDSIRRSDVFLSHGLADVELRRVVGALERETRCAEAWLVRKQLRQFPEERLFVLAVDSGKLSGGRRAEHNEAMIMSLMLTVEVPGRLFIVTPTGEFRSVAGRLMRDESGRIYRRD